MSFCGVAPRAIPWFEGFLGVGLLAFKIRLPDFEKFLPFRPSPPSDAVFSDCRPCSPGSTPSSRKPSPDQLFSAGKISSSLSRRFL